MQSLARMTTLLPVAGVLLLSACGNDGAPETTPAPAPEAAAPEAPAASEPPTLSAILDTQDDAAKARYGARRPAETLEFFGIKPGMRVVEALPGGGWYSKILLPYLGSDGELIGVNYNHSMWSLFGFFPDEQIEKLKTWTTDWPEEAREWVPTDAASISAYEFGKIPASADGQADAVLLIRALHNLSRFEADGGYLTTAISDTYRVLKPGGIVGVVQHRAPDSMPDEAVTGGQGYLRQQAVIDVFTAAGFELVDTSEINANPNDAPGAEDIVWRLPPTYIGVDKDDAEGRAARDAIGESDRMTLKFRKPL